VLNSPDHRALAVDVARKAVTLQRDTAQVVPLSPSDRVLVVVPEAPTRSLAEDDELASSLLGAVQRVAPSAFGAPPETAAAAAGRADVIVFGTYDLAQDPAQQVLAQALVQTGRPVVMVSLRGPYDAVAAPEVGTVLAVYGDRPVHLQAATEALFGTLQPTGRVP